MLDSEKRHLLFLVLFALALRLYVFFTTPVIGTDGYNWFHAARCFAEGDFVAGLKHPTHPIYPLLFAGLTKLIGNYEVAGKAVALIMGILTLFPLYFLVRGAFGHYAGLFASCLLAINPTHVRLSADIMSDTTNLFFFLSAVWMGWEAMKRGSWQWYILAGVCVAMSYFTRAESLALFIVMLPWFILANIREFDRQLLKKIGLFTAPVILLSVPYILFIHKEEGVWHVTQQRAAWLTTKHMDTASNLSGKAKSGLEPEGKVHEIEKVTGWKREGRYHMIFLLILNEFAKDFYQPLLPFLLLGLLRLTRGPSRVELFLLSFFVLYFFLYYLLVYNACYISGRYVLPMAVLSFVWAGAGLERVSQYLRRSVPSLELDTLGFNRAGLFLLLALSAVTLPKDLKIKRKDEVVKREAGYWIKADSTAKNPIVMGLGEVDLEKVAFYAECEFRQLSPAEYSMFQGFVNKWRPNYLLFYKEDLSKEVFRVVNKSEKYTFTKEWVCKRKGRESHLRLYHVKEDP